MPITKLRPTFTLNQDRLDALRALVTEDARCARAPRTAPTRTRRARELRYASDSTSMISGMLWSRVNASLLD